ncbi:hypothetical protein TNCV_1779091 [Trichonephila clavipes]|nr:hypothetical protein TNCV_1779091 [Trichonephila clavipes]
MCNTGVVLFRDNARPHTARRTTAVLTEFGWELFDHSPYSSDLAPHDFYIFLHLKKFLSYGELSGNEISGTIRPTVLKFGSHVVFLRRDSLGMGFEKIDYKEGLHGAL